jgi:energy-coupling factor transport system permease protein
MTFWQGGEERLLPYLIIFLYVLFVTTLFFIQDIVLHGIIALTVFCIAVIVLPLKRLKGGLVPIALFLLFTFAGNLFFQPGRILYGNDLLSVTDEGLLMAAIRTLRILSMIFAAKILTGILSMDEMIHSLEAVLKPLERIGLPVKDFFCVMGLTLKAFPVLMNHLVKTYREEITNHDNHGFPRRMRHIVSFLLPVFVESIRSPEAFFVSSEHSPLPKEKK